MNATVESTSLAYDPEEWEEAIIAERFLYPACTTEEARMLRAFGRFLYHRCLEYSAGESRRESQVIAEVKGAARDLRTLQSFLASTANSFEHAQIAATDLPFLDCASRAARTIGHVVDEMESALGLVAGGITGE